MALKLKLKKSEWDSLEDPQKLLYKPGEGGDYVLDVADLPDYSGLQNLLTSANNEAATRKREVAKWTALGKTPEEIQEIMEAARVAAEKDAEGKGQWELLKTQMNERHAEEIKRWEGKLATANELAGKLKKQLGDNLVDAQATAAIAAEKGVPELLSPIVKRFVKVVEAEDGSFSLQVVDDKGGPRVDGKGNPLTIAALVQEMRQSDTFGRAFEGTGNTGSGKTKTADGKIIVRPEGVPETFAECKTPEQKAAWIKHSKTVDAASKPAAA